MPRHNSEQFLLAPTTAAMSGASGVEHQVVEATAKPWKRFCLLNRQCRSEYPYSLDESDRGNCSSQPEVAHATTA